MDRQRVELRRAERDDSADELGPAARERLCQAATAALADERGATPLPGDQALESRLHAGKRRARAVHVRDHARPARPIAAASQPVAHHRERAVARQEARDQEHRLAATVGDAVAAEDRIAQKRRGLEAHPRLAPERRPGTAWDRRSSSHQRPLQRNQRLGRIGSFAYSSGPCAP
jgi:hypothetical protein